MTEPTSLKIELARKVGRTVFLIVAGCIAICIRFFTKNGSESCESEGLLIFVGVK